MSLARLLPHPRILTIVGAAGIALLASDVALSQQPAGAPPPQVPVETCTPGNCCWIMTKGLSGAFGMAFDQSAGSGHAVLVASGYDRLIHGPTTANACVAYWNRHIATRPGQTPWMAMPVGPLRNLPANPPPTGPGPVAGAPPGTAVAERSSPRRPTCPRRRDCVAASPDGPLALRSGAGDRGQDQRLAPRHHHEPGRGGQRVHVHDAHHRPASGRRAVDLGGGCPVVLEFDAGPRHPRSRR